MLNILKNLLSFLLLSVTLFAGVAPKITSTMTMLELNKLTASDAVADDRFGYYVAISENTAVVGAYYDDCSDGNLDCGAAYIYERNSVTGLFEQIAKLTASDPAEYDYFGNSVAISGDTVVVGAYLDDDGGTNSGSAYLFEKPALGWSNITQSAKLTASDATAYDSFGKNVAISGDTVVVGAYLDDDGGTSSGSAYLFEKPALGWSNMTQSAKLTASDPAEYDSFGNSVAISGDTVVVGAYLDDDGGTNSGSAYLFEKPALGWSDISDITETAKLTASDDAAYDSFGKSVAINGDTVVVGAYGDSDGGTDSGSAYLFEKPALGWSDISDITETAKLTASDAATNDSFGKSVAINGDTVVVGAYYDDDSGTDSGSAYLFEKPALGWSNMTQSAKLTASDTAAYDNFGVSVAISGETVIIGAYYNNNSGSAYIFKNTITQNSIENKKDIIDLNASDADFGDTISFSLSGGDDAAKFTLDATSGLLSFVTAPDFENPTDSDGNNIYETVVKVTDDFGDSDTYKALIRVSNLEYEGKTPKAISFEELNKLTALDGFESDYFGYSVAISGDTAVIGVYGYYFSAGIAYVYELNTSTNLFEQKAKLRASDYAIDDNFGNSVAISGDTVIVGAYLDDDGGNASGSAYLFEKPALGWSNITQSAKLTASDAAAYDNFAKSVAISGDTVVVGAYKDNDDGSSSGSAYLFEKPALGWSNMTQSAKLTAFDAVSSDYFGYSVAISGDTVVVGAYGDDDDGSTSGSAYLFEKPALGWSNITHSAKLTASDAAAYDNFGNSVAISGDTVVVGAYRDDDSGTDSGSAYLFEKPALGWSNITQSAKLTASDAAADDNFGVSVAISGETVVVGAHSDGGGTNSGSAYLFEKPALGWSNMMQSAKLTASDAAAYDNFANNVAISGDTVVAGAFGDDCTDGNIDCGSATIFKAGDMQGINPSIIIYLLN